MERGVRKPFVSHELAVRLAEKIFDIKNASVLEEFDCYSDRAFHIKGFQSSVDSPHGEHFKNDQEFVLKILNSCDSNDLEFVEGENETIHFLQKQGFPCPRVLRPTGSSKNDLKAIVTFPIPEKDSLENKNGSNLERCVVRLMSFLPGKPVIEFCGSSPSLFIIGQFVGLASKTLQSFSHPSILSRQSRWDLKNFPKLESYLSFLISSTKRNLARDVIEQFTTRVVPQFPKLRMGIVHNDMSGRNILGTEADENNLKHLHITGLIDFGDLTHTYLICEIACSMARFMNEDDLLERSGCVLAGYQSRFPLPAHETELLYYFVSACLCATAIISDDQYRLFSTNEGDATTNWKLLKKIWQKPKSQVDEVWADAARKFS